MAVTGKGRDRHGPILGNSNLSGLLYQSPTAHLPPTKMFSTYIGLKSVILLIPDILR
jgi:hypothetical protein